MDNRESSTYYGFILVKRTNGSICGRFPVTKKECIFGRSNNCDIRILLENVSAQHCILLYVDNKVKIKLFCFVFLSNYFKYSFGLKPYKGIYSRQKYSWFH